MLISVNKEGHRFISTNSRLVHVDKHYICPWCGQFVFLKKDNTRIPHFSHYQNSKRCISEEWEPDNELHMMMKLHVYGYFKKFPWVEQIGLEVPIKINDKIELADVYIITKDKDKIVIECEASPHSKEKMLKKTEIFSDVGIYLLYIFEKNSHDVALKQWNEDLYISPVIKDDDIFISRFYVYHQDTTKNTETVKAADRFDKVLYFADRVYSEVHYDYPLEVYFGVANFREYRKDTLHTKYNIISDIQPPEFDLLKEIRKTEDERNKNEEENRKRNTILIKKEDELFSKRDSESLRKQEELNKKKKEELKLKFKEKLDKIDLFEPWAFYERQKDGTNKLLSPLIWNGGSQDTNLRTILEFYKTESDSEKTNILTYISKCGSGKCISGDSLILTNSGIINIEDIVKGKIPGNIVRKTIDEAWSEDIEEITEDNIIDDKDEINGEYIGNIVKSLNLNDTKLEDGFISNVFNIGEEDIIKITTRSGFEIKCTKPHKLIVIDDQCNIIFKEAKDIRNDESIAIANGTELYGEDVELINFYQSDYYRKYSSTAQRMMIPNRMNEELAEFLGYVISEGNRDSKSTEVTNDEEIIRNRIELIINRLGLSTSEVWDSRREKVDGIQTSSVMFNDFLSFIGYKDYSANKEVPWSILRSSKKVQIAFLKALFSGDGYIGNENSNHIEYYTTSKRLAEQIHIMLLNMGIFSSLNEKSAICKTEGYEKDCGICYRVSIFDKKGIIKFIKTIGFIQDYKIKRCIDMLKHYESKQFSYQSRTVRGSYIRLKRIYEEFKKLGKQGKIVKTWEEDVYLSGKNWHVKRRKILSAYPALKDRGFCSIQEWIDGTYSASKRQVLKLLVAMKECYYLEDFKYLYNIAKSNIEFDSVEKIEYGREHVYDLTIENNHSYVGNGFINHNSGTCLHVAKTMGRAIIITPFKNLQRQYYEDYFKGNKFVLKKDGTRLKVSVVLGRPNFKCKWLAEEYDKQQKIIEIGKQHKDRVLPVDEEILKMFEYDDSCANRQLPCTRPLKPLGNGRREPRWSAGSRCPYWIPTPMPKSVIEGWDESDSQREIDSDDEKETRLDKIKKRVHCSTIKYYNSIGQGEVGVFFRDEKDKYGAKLPPACEYYKQFYDFIDADVIVLNSAKWELETQMGRKPAVDVEIIDEGDLWLDKQATTIELRRSIIDKMLLLDDKIKKLKFNTLSIFDVNYNSIMREVDTRIKETNNNTTIIPAIKYKGLFESMLRCINEYAEAIGETEELEKKERDLLNIIKYIDKAFLTYGQGKKEETRSIKIFIPYPDLMLKDLFENSSKNIIITSGTMPSDYVLSQLYAIKEDNYVFKKLYGRKDQPGHLVMMKPDKVGMLEVTYMAWMNPNFRQRYNLILEYILDNIKVMIDKKCGIGEGKIVVLTPAKRYAEAILNRQDVYVDFAKNKNESLTKKYINLNLNEFVDKGLQDIRKIKEDDIDIDGDVLRTKQQIIISTRMTRGTDLKDNKCRAIIPLKWPVPDISDGYYQAIKHRLGDDIFWSIIRDKTERELVQYISRGLRHNDDWCLVATPDAKAFNSIQKLFSK